MDRHINGVGAAAHLAVVLKRRNKCENPRENKEPLQPQDFTFTWKSEPRAEHWDVFFFKQTSKKKKLLEKKYFFLFQLQNLYLRTHTHANVCPVLCNYDVTKRNQIFRI